MVVVEAAAVRVYLVPMAAVEEVAELAELVPVQVQVPPEEMAVILI
jgi:hypothetical protein